MISLRQNKAATRRPAFSMAELLIALSILGFGLAIIAATLPAGLQVMQQNQIRREANATVGDAFEVLSSQIVISDPDDALRRLNMIPLGYQYQLGTDPNNRDNLIRDKYGNFAVDGLPPSVRAWPLVTWNVQFDPDKTDEEDRYEMVSDRRPFRFVTEWLENFSVGGPKGTAGIRYYLGDDGIPPSIDLKDFVDDLMPALRPVDRAFPPVVSRTYRTIDTFFDNPYDEKDSRLLEQTPSSVEEVYHTAQLRERLVGWTTFYRPIDYQAHLYEMITVVTRRPSIDHFFPVQNISGNPGSLNALDLDTPSAQQSGGRVERRILPSPWLVAFAQDGLPFDNSEDLDLLDGTVGNDNLLIEQTGPLVFKCTPELSPLLPEGSRFFPAVQMLSGGISHAALRLSGAQVDQVIFATAPISGERISIVEEFGFPAGDPNQVTMGGRSIYSLDHFGLERSSPRQTDWRTPDDGVFVPVNSAANGPENYMTGNGLAYFELPSDPVTDGGIAPFYVKFKLPADDDFIELGFLNRAPSDLHDLARSATPYVRAERISSSEVRITLAAGPGRRLEQLPRDREPDSRIISKGVLEDIVLTYSGNVLRGDVQLDVDTRIYNTYETGLLQSFTSITGVLPNERAGGSLPIFEVIDRPDDETVVVRNDGLSPWVSPRLLSNSERHRYWPVWVIPPSFATQNGNAPEYDSGSPIVDIQSRIVRLRPPR